MSERLRESLSAMMDDEANELEIERVLSQVATDAQLRETWTHYHFAQAALSGQEVAYPQLDVSAGVRNAIDSEPLASEEPVESLRQRVLRPLASLAVAASVTATVVIGGQQLSQLGADPYATGGNSVAVTTSPVGIVNTTGAIPVRASYGTQPLPVLLPATRMAYDELARHRMDRYMQEHAEHAALNSPQGLIPFSRVPKIKE